MNPEEYTFDLMRIFFGELPPLVYAEILLRTAVMYAYTFVIIRYLGKRESGALSPFELIIVISVGSAVGDPMFYPEVPLFHGFAVVTVVALLQRLLEDLTNRFPWLERRVEGKARVLVRDGQIDLENLEQERLSQRELFSALRTHQVAHLGEVHRAYFEPSGQISVFKHEEGKTRPGLSLHLSNEEEQSEAEKNVTHRACGYCGFTHSSREQRAACPRCGNEQWEAAVE